MKVVAVFVSAGLMALLAACNSGPKSGRGLHLPDGNVEQGKIAFVALKCTECHSVSDVVLERPGTVKTNIMLGGTVLAVRSYGELVTSVINPSHGLRRGEPASGLQMPDFNKMMTVQQMIDVVAFLQSHYEVERDPMVMK